jgi:membrane protein implicated in regulation of membrane protease activity
MMDEASIIKRFVLGLGALGSLFLAADRAHAHGNVWPAIIFFAILAVALLDYIRRMVPEEDGEESEVTAEQQLSVVTQLSLNA